MLPKSNVFAQQFQDIGGYSHFNSLSDLRNYYNQLSTLNEDTRRVADEIVDSMSAHESGRTRAEGQNKYIYSSASGANGAQASIYKNSNTVAVFDTLSINPGTPMMVMKTSDGYWAMNLRTPLNRNHEEELGNRYNLNIRDSALKIDLKNKYPVIEEMENANLSQNIIDAYVRFKEDKYSNPQQRQDDIAALRNSRYFTEPSLTGIINPQTGAYQNSTPTLDFLTPAEARTNSEVRAGINNTMRNGGVPENDHNGQCVYGTVIPSIDVDNCLEQGLYYIMSIIAWFVGVAAGVFSFIFNFTVVHMSENLKNITAIGSVWKVLRDFANILFIFILLFLAISTILGINEHGIKHTLSKLILVAILMNFSMFFAKVIIDSSNILAISFYQKVNPEARESETSGNIAQSTPESVKKGIAGVFMNTFNFQKIYQTNGSDPAASFAMLPNTGTIFIMGSITMFIVACLFVGATIIFIKRMTTLMILIMTSSLAFAGTLLHKTEGMAHEWWEKLLREAFYAPIFIAILWMAFLIMTNPGFLKTMGDGGSGLTQAFFDIPMVVNYIIVINFFVMALVVGEKMGASGASGAMKLYKGIKTNIGGRAVQMGVRRGGAWAYKYLEGKAGGKPHAFVTWATKAMAGQAGIKILGKEIPGTKKLAEVAASLSRGALGAVVNAKVGGAGNSFREEFAEKQHAIAEHEYEIKDDLGKVGEFYTELVTDGQKDLNVRVAYEKAWEAKDAKGQADILAAMADSAAKYKLAGNTEKAEEIEEARKKLIGRLSPQQQDDMEKKMQGPLAFHKQKFDELLQGESDGHGGRAGGVEQITEYQTIHGTDNAKIKESVKAKVEETKAKVEALTKAGKTGTAEHTAAVNEHTEAEKLSKELKDTETDSGKINTIITASEAKIADLEKNGKGKGDADYDKEIETLTKYQAIKAGGGKISLTARLAGAEEVRKKLRQKGKKVGDADYDEAAKQVDELKKKVETANVNLNQNEKVQKFRKNFQGLSTSQQAGLNINQIRNPLVTDLVQGKLFAQLESSGNLTQEDYDRLGKSMDDQITQLETYVQAQTKGKKGDRADVLKMVNAKLRSLGEDEIQVINGDTDDAEDRAMDYYEENMFKGHLATAGYARNASRSYSTTKGQNGEKLNGKAGDAIRRDANGNSRRAAVNGTVNDREPISY